MVLVEEGVEMELEDMGLKELDEGSQAIIKMKMESNAFSKTTVVVMAEAYHHIRLNGI